MKKVKLAFWFIILVLFALIAYQNQEYFLAKHSIGINLYFTEGITPEVYNLIIVVVFFGAGLLVAYISSLFERFKANKTIKELRITVKSLQDNMTGMKKDVDSLKFSAGSENGSETGDSAETESSDVEKAPISQA